MEKVKNLLGQDKFSSLVGIELLEVGPGQARARLELREGLLNGLGTVQGGAIFTLVDLTGAAATNSHGTRRC